MCEFRLCKGGKEQTEFISISLTSGWALSVIIQLPQAMNWTAESTNVSISLSPHQLLGLSCVWFSRCTGYLCRTATSTRTARSVRRRGTRTAAGVWERAGEWVTAAALLSAGSGTAQVLVCARGDCLAWWSQLLVLSLTLLTGIWFHHTDIDTNILCTPKSPCWLLQIWLVWENIYFSAGT